jgi:hypothetical protein
MNRLTALLDWIDEAAGGLICLAYLAAGVTAVAVYFGADELPPRVRRTLNQLSIRGRDVVRGGALFGITCAVPARGGVPIRLGHVYTPRGWRESHQRR